MAKKVGVDITDELGAHLGKNPALAHEVCKAISGAIKIPVMAKMTPEADTDLVANACYKGGAAAVSAINCPMSLPGLDIYNDGRPIYPTTANQSFAGLCGEWIRPLAYRHVAQIATKNPDIPIAGGGGLMGWRHSVEMIMYGASVLTYCSLLYRDGYKALPKIEKGLLRFMNEKGYETIDDFKGLGLKHIVTPQKVDYVDKLPVIDEEKCNGCRICVDLGHCEVMGFDEEKKKAKVESPEKCYYCAVCFWRCPKEAISMVPGGK